HRQIAWLFPIENPAGVNADLPIDHTCIDAIAHQAPGLRKFAEMIHGGDFVTSCQGHEPITARVKKWPRGNHDCADAPLRNRVESCVDLRISARLEFLNLDAERGRRLPQIA